MKIEKHGIILNVEKFDECVAFYKDLFKLSEMFSKVEDTMFRSVLRSYVLTC
jgi:lactoylglutathione lyase